MHRHAPDEVLLKSQTVFQIGSGARPKLDQAVMDLIPPETATIHPANFHMARHLERVQTQVELAEARRVAAV
jgi:hypothetical protein